MRQYLMDGDFFAGVSLATTLTKLALRYVSLTHDTKKQNVRFSTNSSATNLSCMYFSGLYLADLVCLSNCRLLSPRPCSLWHQ